MTNLKVVEGKGLIHRFADRYGVDADKMMATLKATAFKQSDKKDRQGNYNKVEVSNEQMMALLVVADQYNLNPWTKEIYAFPDKGGIIPIVGVDGWSRIINENPNFNGMDFNQSETMVEPVGGKACPEWIECVIYRKDREHPVKIKEYLDEVYRAAFTGTNNGKSYTKNGPWQTHTKRMLRHKAMIQCSRIAFAYTGVYDQDEAERIIEAEVIDNSAEMLADAIIEHKDTIDTVKLGLQAGEGTPEFQAASEAYYELTNEERISIWAAPSKGGPFTTKEREMLKSHAFRTAHINEDIPQ